ncbi:hypothetical protein NC651_008062 [Populus alba x Populus x berolinensis]|nr:hypothetical protein NC651_008062 [Populus alba x Populus x berolinensis]
MEHFRSRSCREGRIQMEGYHGDKAAPANMKDLRSYSVCQQRGFCTAKSTGQRSEDQEREKQSWVIFKKMEFQ